MTEPERDPSDYRESVEGKMGDLLKLLFERKKLLEVYPSANLPDVELINYALIKGGDKYLKDWMDLDIKVEDHLVEIHNIPEVLESLFMYQHWAMTYNLIVIDDFETMLEAIIQIYGYEGTPAEDIMKSASFWMDNDELGRWYASFDEGN